MEYRREIDGLRAIAVLPVIFFHAGFEAFEGGFVGVDVFFVVSGYLITTIILTDMNKGKFSVLTFYERRARRILPALFFVMFCSLPFAWAWLLPNHLEDFSQSLIAVSAFSSNILFWKEAGYFATVAELKPLLHTWSLAVEEQYYVLFPLFLMALWKLRKRWLFGALMVVGAISLIVAQWGAYNKPAATFFLLPTRVWELAVGALIAFYFLYKREQKELVSSYRILSEALGLLGLSLILYSVFSFSKATPFPSLYALLPTLGTGLIIMFSTAQTIAGRLLSTKTMVGIGLISYSTYLWHQPLFVFARHRSLNEPSFSLLLILSVLSVVLAFFSWRYVEVPFRNKTLFNRKKVFTFAVLGSFFFAIAGLAGHVSNGFDKRVNKDGVILADIPEKVIINRGLSADCEDAFTLSPNCRTSDNPEILLWGDSYAMHLAQGIVSSNKNVKMIQMTKSFCGPFVGLSPSNKDYPVRWAKGCLDFNESVLDWLDSNETVKYVILSSQFSQYLDKDNFLLTDEKLYKADNGLAKEYFVSVLDKISAMGKVPIIFSPTPQNGNNIGECLVKSEFLGVDPSNCDFSKTSASYSSDQVLPFLETLSNRYKVVFLDKGICERSICKTNIDGTFIYRDYGHLSCQGSALLGKRMGFYNLIVGVD